MQTTRLNNAHNESDFSKPLGLVIQYAYNTVKPHLATPSLIRPPGHL